MKHAISTEILDGMMQQNHQLANERRRQNLVISDYTQAPPNNCFLPPSDSEEEEEEDEEEKEISNRPFNLMSLCPPAPVVDIDEPDQGACALFFPYLYYFLTSRLWYLSFLRLVGLT